MKKVFIIITVFSSFAVFAQEEEYYKTPKHRSKSYEVESLPNLSSKFSSFYTDVSGGFRKPFYSLSENFESFGAANHPMNSIFQLSLGLNFNNNSFIETGLVQIKNNLSTLVYPAQHNQWGFTLSSSFKQYYIPVIFKKRLLNLNRITKNAYINLGIGGGFEVASSPSEVRSFSLDVQNEIKSPLLSNFYVTLSNSQSPIYGELGVEIKGNVTDRLELLVFVKGLFRENKYLSNNFELVYSGSGRVDKHYIFEKSAALAFGLQVRFNSRKFYRYSSRI